MKLPWRGSRVPKGVVYAGIVFALLPVTGCGGGGAQAGQSATPLGTSEAVGICESSGLSFAKEFGTATAVAAGYRSNAGSVAAWQDARLGEGGPHGQGTSPFESHPSAQTVFVCYIDGDFPHLPGPPPAPNETPSAVPDYNRILVELVVGGQPVFDAAGHTDTLDAGSHP